MGKKNNSRIFITGAGGFIGANIIRHFLKKGYQIHVLNHKDHIPWRLNAIAQQITVHKGDLLHAKPLQLILKRIQPDYIFHLAAYGAYHTQTDMEKIIHTNVAGLTNLLSATKDIPYKLFINCGSSSEYGFKSLPMKETDSCEPISYYAVSKLTATTICQLFAQEHNKQIVTLRLFSVYGPFEESFRFIPTIITSLLQQQPIILTLGTQRRDFIYIDDVCTAFEKVLSSRNDLSGGIFNIGTGSEYTNDEIVERLFQVTGQKTAVQKGAYPPHRWDTNHWVADISLTKKVLKWQPKYSIDKGLQSSYSWFQNHTHEY